MKDKFRKFFLQVAKASAELSYANRLKVGAVVFKDNRILSTGYNGTPTGSKNNCEDEYGNTRPEVIHSEENAIAFMAKLGIASDGCYILVTHSPCFECSKLIIQSGIKKVYYENLYKDTAPLKFLRENGVEVFQINQEGEVDWDLQLEV